MSSSMSLSSKALCESSHGQDSCYFNGLEEYENNPYNELTNPSGIIQMGLAENQLCFDLLESWLARNPDVTRFRKDDGGSIFKELALFQDYHGLQAFKNELVDFMAEIRRRKVKLDPEKLVLTAGATSANETIMFCLADPGDAILIPTPYYPGFDRDLRWRTGVEIVPIDCFCSNGFRITIAALEEAYNKAHGNHLKVKGLLITNPSNPLGTTMSDGDLHQIIHFAMSKNLHIVCDEIYAGTVFGDIDSPRFTSILETLLDRNLENHDIWSRVHLVSSLSKDLGLPGFRIGMIYSNNEALLSAATKMSSFGLVSSQTQHLISKILGDKELVKNYMKENKKRLRQRQQLLVGGLERCGIECLKKSNAGLFCWVDLRHLMSSNTFEAETDVWRKILSEVGLNITPGSSCHCAEPGWFRVCFANMPEGTLRLALQRITAWLQHINYSNNKNPPPPNHHHHQPSTNGKNYTFPTKPLEYCTA